LEIEPHRHSFFLSVSANRFPVRSYHARLHTREWRRRQKQRCRRRWWIGASLEIEPPPSLPFSFILSASLFGSLLPRQTPHTGVAAAAETTVEEEVEVDRGIFRD